MDVQSNACSETIIQEKKGQKLGRLVVTSARVQVRRVDTGEIIFPGKFRTLTRYHSGNTSSKSRRRPPTRKGGDSHCKRKKSGVGLMDRRGNRLIKFYIRKKPVPRPEKTENLAPEQATVEEPEKPGACPEAEGSKPRRRGPGR